MNFSKNIQSYLLLILYVLSGTHGAAVHCHDSDHSHLEHSHNHEGHHHEGEEISFLHSVTHDFIHSIAHFIEHSANDHDCCDKALMVGFDTVKISNSFNSAIATTCKQKSKFHLKQNRCKTGYIADPYIQIFLSYSSLRGPPSIV